MNRETYRTIVDTQKRISQTDADALLNLPPEFRETAEDANLFDFLVKVPEFSCIKVHQGYASCLDENNAELEFLLFKNGLLLLYTQYNPEHRSAIYNFKNNMLLSEALSDLLKNAHHAEQP